MKHSSLLMSFCEYALDFTAKTKWNCVQEWQHQPIFHISRPLLSISIVDSSITSLLSRSMSLNQAMEDTCELDLVYVTERIIAVNFASTSEEQTFRSNLKEVAQMLKSKHADSYLVRHFQDCSSQHIQGISFHKIWFRKSHKQQSDTISMNLTSHTVSGHSITV